MVRLVGGDHRHPGGHVLVDLAGGHEPATGHHQHHRVPPGVEVHHLGLGHRTADHHPVHGGGPEQLGVGVVAARPGRADVATDLEAGVGQRRVLRARRPPALQHGAQQRHRQVERAEVAEGERPVGGGGERLGRDAGRVVAVAHDPHLVRQLRIAFAVPAGDRLVDVPDGDGVGEQLDLPLPGDRLPGERLAVVDHVDRPAVAEVHHVRDLVGLPQLPRGGQVHVRRAGGDQQVDRPLPVDLEQRLLQRGTPAAEDRLREDLQVLLAQVGQVVQVSQRALLGERADVGLQVVPEQRQLHHPDVRVHPLGQRVVQPVLALPRLVRDGDRGHVPARRGELVRGLPHPVGAALGRRRKADGQIDHVRSGPGPSRPGELQRVPEISPVVHRFRSWEGGGERNGPRTACGPYNNAVPRAGRATEGWGSPLS